MSALSRRWLPLSVRLAIRELAGERRFTLFFIANLAIGLAGFVALDAFSRSVDAELTARSRTFLGADLTISAPRPLERPELLLISKHVGEQAELAVSIELFSMAGGGGRARLAEVRAIGPGFPLYGESVLETRGARGPETYRELVAEQGAFIDPALASSLRIGVGDEITIGGSPFRVLDTIARESGRAAGGFSIAPRVYIALEHLEATGLAGFGSRVNHRRLYRFAGADPVSDAELEAIGQRLDNSLVDPRVDVQTHLQATRRLARVYGAVTDYLGLVALIAVFLAALGAAYLFRAYLVRRLKDWAILLSLGVTRTRAQGIFVLQLVLLGLAAGLVSCALGALALPALGKAAAAFVPVTQQPSLGWATVAAVLVIALGGSSLACLPLIVRVRGLRPAELFREHARPQLERGASDLLWLIPALIFFFALAIWRADSVRVGLAFSGIFVASLVVVALMGRLGLRLLATRAGGVRALVPRFALRQLARHPASALPAFVAISLCALLVAVPLQMRGLLEAELDPPEGGALPSLFLFDIQPEQLELLRGEVEELGAPLDEVSPMVRARLDAINGVATADTIRAAAAGGDDDRARLGGRRYNLTYRAGFSSSEELVEGREFRNPSVMASDEEPAELSLEAGFADRLGVGLGDVLRFDVQGVPVSGRVVNTKRVRWNSLQPNFFVSFQSGVLEEAPKIFLASIPRLDQASRERVAAALVESFPNVSVIDVTAGVKRLIGLLGQLDWALFSTASLALLVGMLLIFAIARDQARARRWETNLLKILGAGFPQIRRAGDIEFGLLGGAAALLGVLSAAGASAILALGVFDLAWRLSWLPLAGVLVVIPLVCVSTARIAMRKVLRERPIVLLRDG